jgi:hypothetical protein
MNPSNKDTVGFTQRCIVNAVDTSGVKYVNNMYEHSSIIKEALIAIFGPMNELICPKWFLC